MVSGINNSQCVIVFVTKKYTEKVAGNNAEDNCQLEFNYSARMKTANHMIPVVMEKGMENTRTWKGEVGMVLGGQKYVRAHGDLNDEAYLNKTANELYDDIMAMIHHKKAKDFQLKDTSSPIPLNKDMSSSRSQTEVRDCPACVTEISSSSDLSSSNKTALQSSVQATPVNAQLKTTNPSVESNFRKHIYPDGGVYEGDYEDDKKNGKGKYTWSDGGVYEGDYKDDKMNGKGKFTWPDGGVYEGDFKDEKMNGKGKLTYSDGRVYDGDWKDDKRNGKGKDTWSDGRVYDGDWKDHKRNGKGKHTWSDGAVYDGDYKDDKRNGKGKYTWSDGGVYEGDYKDDQRNGKGKETYPDGGVYEGDYKDDKRNGKGKYTWPDGRVYEGDWKDDQMSINSCSTM